MDEKYITVQEAQDILRVSARQVQYHAANNKIRSRKVGRKLELLAEDVDRLADEQHASEKTPRQPAIEMLPDTGPMIDYIRELHNQSMVMAKRIGELEAMLQQRLLPEDAEELRKKLIKVEAERDLLLEQLKQNTSPTSFWKRLIR